MKEKLREKYAENSCSNNAICYDSNSPFKYNFAAYRFYKKCAFEIAVIIAVSAK